MSAETAAKSLGTKAQTNNPNNAKPFRYEDYVARKQRIQQTLEKKFTKWNLPDNFAKIELNESIQPSATVLLSQLIQTIGKENEKSIKSFGPGQSSSCWLIGFDSKATKERILQTNPTILNRVRITDANEKISPPAVTCNGKFRIHKLPPHIEIEAVDNYLKKNIKINSFRYRNIQKEKYKDTEIENGIVSFQMSYSIEDHNQVQALIGTNYVNKEYKIFFQLCGHQSKCNICKTFGHHSKMCPKIDLKCTKCKGRGHTEQNCNFANMTRGNSDEDIDEYINEEENILEINNEENDQNKKINENTHNSDDDNNNIADQPNTKSAENESKNEPSSSELAETSIASMIISLKSATAPSSNSFFKPNAGKVPPPPVFNPTLPSTSHLNSTTSTPTTQSNKRSSKEKSASPNTSSDTSTLESKKPNINNGNRKK